MSASIMETKVLSTVLDDIDDNEEVLIKNYDKRVIGNHPKRIWVDTIKNSDLDFNVIHNYDTEIIIKETEGLKIEYFSFLANKKAIEQSV